VSSQASSPSRAEAHQYDPLGIADDGAPAALLFGTVRSVGNRRALSVSEHMRHESIGGIDMVVHPWIHSPFAGTDEDQLPSTGERLSAPLRELAQRVSGSDEVLLLWDPESQRVELSVRDVASGASFHVEVEPVRAMDAFHHPYAYVARRENSDRVVRAVATVVEGMPPA
jgi:hypothetical protein